MVLTAGHLNQINGIHPLFKGHKALQKVFFSLDIIRILMICIQFYRQAVAMSTFLFQYKRFDLHKIRISAKETASNMFEHVLSSLKFQRKICILISNQFTMET